MTLVIVASALVLIALAALAIAWPLWKEREGRQGANWTEAAVIDPLEELLEQRNSTYRAIRELRFDYQVGKVSEADYQAFDAQLKSQAVAVLKQIDALAAAEADSALDARVEAEIAALRQATAA